MKSHSLRFSLALALGAMLVIGVVASARAGEDPTPVPTTQPVAERVAETPATPAAGAEVAAETKTTSPVHSILFWVAARVTGGDCKEACCPSADGGAKAWRAWYAGGADVPLADLRDALVRDGWTADRTIGWFEKQAASGACGKACDQQGAKESAKGSCDGCPQAGATEKVPTATPAVDRTKDGGCCGKCEDKGACKEKGPCKTKGECKGDGAAKSGCKSKCPGSTAAPATPTEESGS